MYSENQISFYPNVVIVREKDGMKFCIDHRKLSQRTFPDVYAIPPIDTILHKAGAQYFSTLDAKSGYWQVEL